MNKTIFLIPIIIIALTYEALGAPSNSLAFPSLLNAVKNIKSLSFCNERVPMENRDVMERMEKELLLSLGNRPQVILWLKRSRRYFPIIEKMLKKNNMPEDLKYIAVAESALLSYAGSKDGAIGYWQILPDIGRKYGLIINEAIDERRSIFASSQAAIKHLRALHQSMGSWTLAAAAYNMGEEGLEAEIMVQHTRDYYRLYLPIETQRFIFRILSVKLILSNPDGFGFHLTDSDYYPPLKFDEIQIDCFQEIPLAIVAKASETDFKVIKDLNPEIRGHYLMAGSRTILIPKGTNIGFIARYKKLVKDYEEKRSDRVYIIKEGDNLSTIAEKFDVPLAALIIWNRIDLNKPIHPGERLIIYPKQKTSGKDARD